MAHLDPPSDAAPAISPPPPASPPQVIPAPPTGLVLIALTILLTFVVAQGRAPGLEWSELQREIRRVRQTVVDGYHNSNPNHSYAQKPDDWSHDEGEYTLLRSGWKHGDGHHWFRIGRGGVDRGRISLPFGRDAIQAIDYPMIETEGGAIWERIPPEAPVVGQELGGVARVYPLQGLDKVEVVNDLIEGRPSLIVYNPMSTRDRSVGIYEPVVGGHRVTLGLSGYSHDHQPMPSDRGTECLWVHEGGGIRAIAGAHKRTRLRRIGQPAPVP